MYKAPCMPPFFAFFQPIFTSYNSCSARFLSRFVRCVRARAGFMMEGMKRILGCMALGLVTIMASAQWSNPADDIPAYNAKPPVKPLKPTLSGDQLTGEY